MINYEVKRKHITNDVFGIEKAAYDALENKLKEMVQSKLSNFDLSRYDVNVYIDLEEGQMKVSSPDMPTDLVSRVQEALSSLGNH